MQRYFIPSPVMESKTVLHGASSLLDVTGYGSTVLEQSHVMDELFGCQVGGGDGSVKSGSIPWWKCGTRWRQMLYLFQEIQYRWFGRRVNWWGSS